MTELTNLTTVSQIPPQLNFEGYFQTADKIGITGKTLGFADGTEVNLLIMDIMGNSTSVSVTVQGDSFEVSNIDAKKFTPGNLTMTATAGNTLSQATLTLAEIVSGDPIVIDPPPELNGLNQLNIQGKAPSLQPNDVLTMVVRDTSGTSVTTTAVVQANGTFSVSGLSTQGLKDGLLIIDVKALTNNGAISVVNAANVLLSNLTPAGTDKTLEATEDTALVVRAADFGYIASGSYSMTGVKIAGLPAQGTLKLNGVAVVMDQFVKLADLEANELIFQGAGNAYGTNYANLKFKVMDNRPVNNEDLVANTLTINVAAVNDAAVISGTSTGAVIEAGGVANGIAGTPNATGTLISTDVDGTPNAFTAVAAGAASTGGYGTYGMTAAGVWTYTLDNTKATVQALKAGQQVTDTFTVTAADGTPRVINVTITGANDAPVNNLPAQTSGNEDTDKVITGLSVADVDATGNITVTLAVTNGTPTQPGTLTLLAGTDVTLVGNNSNSVTLTGTPGAINALLATANAVTFKPTANFYGNATLTMTSSDGTLTDSDFVNITVNAVNDAPVMTDTNLNLENVDPVAGSPVGATGSLVSSFMGGVSDVDNGAVRGMAITGVDTTRGTLWYSTNGGSIWTEVTQTLSNTNALLIGSDTDNRLYFKPLAGAAYGQFSATLTFRAWDQTTGTEGSYASTSPNGTTTAFSAGVETIDQTIFHDEAPTLVGSNPSDNGFMMNVTNNLTLTFSEVVKQGTGLIQLYKADGTLVQNFDVAVTSTALTWSGNTLTINPAADLDFNTGYYIKVAPTAVKDLVGNAYAGIADTTTLNFTTVDSSGIVDLTGQSVDAGFAVSTAGDVNGDGYDDVIIGFPSSGQAQPWITPPPSTAFVLYGNSDGTLPAFPAGSTFGTLAADKGFKIQGVSGALVGTSVSSAGDINGDGLSDLIVGAPGYAAGDSMPTYVVYGSTRNTDILVDALSHPMASSLGFKIDSTPGMGRTVANAGDVNGDGLADIIVTSANDATPPSYAGAYASETYVLFGNSNGVYPSSVSSTTVLNASQGFRIISPGGQGRFIAASSLGDVNGDGYADILVKEASKGVHVVYGGSQPITVNLTDGSFNSSQGYTIQTYFDSNNNTGDITGLGDINGDGLSDFAFSNPGAGQVTVVYGSTTPINMLDLRGDATVDSKLGFRISVKVPGDQLIGTGIANAGDMNGDGYDDMVFGLQNDSYGWVVYGGPDNTSFQLPLSGAIAPSRGFQFKTNAGNGEILATAGDFNGDGLSDLVFGWGILLGGTQWVSNYILVGNGTSAGEAMIGTAGNDTLVGGGGVDRFYAGKGNDTIVITASDVANLANNSAAAAKSVIDAGHGYDTLRLSGGANLNLLTITNAGASGSKADSRIDSIERIDLATDSDANTVTLSALDVNDMAGFDRIHIGSVSEDGKTWSNVTGAALSTTTQYHQLVVDGGSNDVLNLQNGLGVWVNAGTVSDGTNPYVVYQNAISHSQVLVRSGVQTLINDPPLLLGSSPSDNGFMMKMDDSITLTYSEAIYQGVGVIELYRADDTLVESFDVATSTKVTGWGAAGNTLTINPTADLTVGTGYYIKVSTTAITDATGVAFAPVNDKTTVNFTTVNADGSVNGTSALGGGVKSVSSVGDVNGDGFDDFAVGANGAAYVIYGSSSAFLPDLSSISNLPSRGFKLTDAPGANLGASVSGLGDINGDGYADLIVGANNYNVSNSEGIARVIYGGANMGSTPTSAFTLLGGYYGALGQSVSGIGDFNGDGINDMIAGAPGTDSSAGAAYIVYGSSNLASTIQVGNSSYPMEASSGFYLSGAAASGEKAGYSVSGAGDVNGDGLADVVVGAYNALSGKGTAYVIFGTTTSTSGALANRVAAGGGFRIDGDTGQGLGYQVASAGDVNGDGLGDVIVSTNSANADFSAAYVVFGKASTTSVTVSNLNASQGFSILGGSAESYIRGVSSAGDINGDGLSDLIVGAKNGDTYVVYGKSSGTSVNLSSATIATSTGFKIDSRFYDDAYGGLNTQLIESVSSAGDINGDGLSDLIIGIPADDSNGGYSVVLGGTQWVTSAVYSNRGTVTGTTLSEALIGGEENETLNGGGGVDRFFAGLGNDTILLTASDITNLGSNAVGGVKASINGGGGFDTIDLTGGANLNLTNISNAGAMGIEENSRIESIERIAMGADTVANTLTLTARDVKDMAGFDVFHTGSLSEDGKTWTNVTGTALRASTKFHQLLVDGSDNDTLEFAPDLGFWSNVGTVSNGSLTYTVYQNTGTKTQVLVRSVMTVTNNDSVAPVVLDLNCDGDLSYSQMLMDVNSDGQMDLTAWAAAEDGVLVWDKLGDGLVHNNSQYAFAQYAGFAGATDLQGLEAAFDTNHDGVFNVQDANFGEFKVWQDANQNGVSDAGEVRSLADWGMASIQLTSDGVVRAPAVGVQEAGRSTAKLADGGVMLVADAAFAFQTSDAVQLDVANFVATSSKQTLKAPALPAEATVKLFLYDMLQSATADVQGSASLSMFADGAFSTSDSGLAGHSMDLLADQLLRQSLG